MPDNSNSNHDDHEDQATQQSLSDDDIDVAHDGLIAPGKIFESQEASQHASDEPGGGPLRGSDATNNDKDKKNFGVNQNKQRPDYNDPD